MKNYENLTILVAEDDDGHAELIKEGLKDAGVCNDIVRFNNGKKCWDYINKNSEQNCLYLLLLDINMPIMDGLELLEKMKRSEYFKKIPIIMLTTTDDPKEIEHCYKLGCNAYVSKPINFNAFAEVLKTLGLFVKIVKL